MIYLASPYTSPEPHVMENRYKSACVFCGIAMKTGIVIYSPIAHWHSIAKIHHLPVNYLPWKKQDEGMIDICEALWVFTVEGWKESVGVQAEIKYALSLLKGIAYVNILSNRIVYERLD